MGQIFLLSLTAALNPVLVGASTVMLLLPNPKRLMLGYLLGALMTSITLGLVIVYALKGSSAVSTTQNTVSPAVDLALGAILLVAAAVLGTGRDKQIAERGRARKGPKEEKGPPRWQQALSKGSARTTFVVGAVLTLPGGSYLAGLHHIEEQKLSTPATVLTVIGFNLVMLILLELPLLGYTFAPDWTPSAVERAKAWAGRNGHKAAVITLTVLGGALVVKGIAELVS
jgi:Sap, sulfolipid-1-addressing protein